MPYWRRSEICLICLRNRDAGRIECALTAYATA
jgi:hypothetical protein